MTFVEMVNQLLISNANIPLFFIFLLSSNAIFFHYCPVNCSNSAKATRSCPKGSYAGTVPQYEKLMFFIQTNRPRGFQTTASTCISGERLKLYSALQMMQDCSVMWIDSEPGMRRFFAEQNVAHWPVARTASLAPSIYFFIGLA